MREVQPRGPECHAIGELLSDYLDGDLDLALRQQVEAHLRSCPHCTADLEDLRLTVQALRALPVVAPPRSFALPETPRPSSWFVRLRLATSAVAALFVLTLVASAYLPSGTNVTPDVAPISLTAPQSRLLEENAPTGSTASQPASDSGPVSPLPLGSMETPVPPEERAAVAASQLGTPATTEATEQTFQAAAAPAPSPAPEGTPATLAAAEAQSTPIGDGTKQEADAAAQAQMNAASSSPATSESGTPGEAASGGATTMLAPAEPEAGTAERQNFALDAETFQTPAWRVWLNWLPIVLGSLVVVLGAATTVTWLRERR